MSQDQTTPRPSLDAMMEFWRALPSYDAAAELVRRHSPCRLHDGRECEGPTDDCDPENCNAVQEAVRKAMTDV